jgi:hypothetical protein
MAILKKPQWRLRSRRGAFGSDDFTPLFAVRKILIYAGDDRRRILVQGFILQQSRNS